MELTYRLLVGDCRAQMATLPDCSVDAIVTDPPYELGFMGKSWDASGIAYDGEVWRQALRVLKPGGHLLAFSGSRTYHRMVVAIEDAGFEIRDQIMWLYGSGFPKSHDVSKAIDREAGAVRRVVGKYRRPDGSNQRKAESSGTSIFGAGGDQDITAPATPEAARWQGWGTALKPAHEPICVARKPLRGTVAQNVLAYGTGAINVDGCRVAMQDDDFAKLAAGVDAIRKRGGSMANSWKNSSDLSGANPANPAGRWPANVIHDGSEEVVGMFPVTGPSKAAARGGTSPNPMGWGSSRSDGSIVKGHDDAGGSAARFFYSAKASKADRDEGMEGWDEQAAGGLQGRNDGSLGSITMRANVHPTVKPTDLMRYLVRLVTPPGGTVLDPFTGSGSTGKAAVLEGFRFIGCELSPDYAAIAEARIANAAQRMGLPHEAPASLPQPVQVREDGLQQLTLGLAIG